MNARNLSRILTILSIVSMMVAIVYSVISMGMLKTNISGLTNEEVINEKVANAGRIILIIGGVGCGVALFASLFAVMFYTMVGNTFKPDKLFVFKMAMIFIPMFVIIFIFVALRTFVK